MLFATPLLCEAEVPSRAVVVLAMLLVKGLCAMVSGRLDGVGAATWGSTPAEVDSAVDCALGSPRPELERPKPRFRRPLLMAPDMSDVAGGADRNEM